MTPRGALRPREELCVVADAEALTHAAAERVCAAARGALAERGSFHLALAGGSTPRALYGELARRAAADFAGWHLWFGDERCVPPEHADSNYRMVAESGLLTRLAPARVHRLRGEAPDPAAEAERYARELETVLGREPRLDLILLGLGADGHTASLFPGTPALSARTAVAVGRAPRVPVERLTLTFEVLARARALVFLVAGSDKASALAATLAPGNSAPPPARRAYPSDGSLQWLVERAALAERTESPGTSS